MWAVTVLGFVKLFFCPLYQIVFEVVLKRLAIYVYLRQRHHRIFVYIRFVGIFAAGFPDNFKEFIPLLFREQTTSNAIDKPLTL